MQFSKLCGCGSGVQLTTADEAFPQRHVGISTQILVNSGSCKGPHRRSTWHSKRRTSQPRPPAERGVPCCPSASAGNDRRRSYHAREETARNGSEIAGRRAPPRGRPRTSQLTRAPTGACPASFAERPGAGLEDARLGVVALPREGNAFLNRPGVPPRSLPSGCCCWK